MDEQKAAILFDKISRAFKDRTHVFFTSDGSMVVNMRVFNTEAAVPNYLVEHISTKDSRRQKYVLDTGSKDDIQEVLRWTCVKKEPVISLL